MPRSTKYCEYRHLTIKGPISTGGNKTKELFPLLFFFIRVEHLSCKIYFSIFLRLVRERGIRMRSRNKTAGVASCSSESASLVSLILTVSIAETWPSCGHIRTHG